MQELELGFRVCILVMPMADFKIFFSPLMISGRHHHGEKKMTNGISQNGMHVSFSKVSWGFFSSGSVELGFCKMDITSY